MFLLAGRNIFSKWLPPTSDWLEGALERRLASCKETRPSYLLLESAKLARETEARDHSSKTRYKTWRPATPPVPFDLSFRNGVCIIQLSLQTRSLHTLTMRSLILSTLISVLASLPLSHAQSTAGVSVQSDTNVAAALAAANVTVNTNITVEIAEANKAACPSCGVVYVQLIACSVCAKPTYTSVITSYGVQAASVTPTSTIALTATPCPCESMAHQAAAKATQASVMPAQASVQAAQASACTTTTVTTTVTGTNCAASVAAQGSVQPAMVQATAVAPISTVTSACPVCSPQTITALGQMVSSVVQATSTSTTSCPAGQCIVGAQTTTVTAPCTLSYMSTTICASGSTCTVNGQAIMPISTSTIFVTASTTCPSAGVYTLGGMTTSLVSAQQVSYPVLAAGSTTTFPFWQTQIFAGQTVSAASQAITSSAQMTKTTSTYCPSAGVYTLAGVTHSITQPQWITYVIIITQDYVCEAAQCLGAAPTKSINVYEHNGNTQITAYGLILIDIVVVQYITTACPTPTTIINVDVSIVVSVAPTTITYPITVTTTSTITVSASSSLSASGSATQTGSVSSSASKSGSVSASASASPTVVPVTTAFSLAVAGEVIVASGSSLLIVSPADTTNFAAVSFTINTVGQLVASTGATVVATFSTGGAGPLVFGGSPAARRKRQGVLVDRVYTAAGGSLTLNDLIFSSCPNSDGSSTPDVGDSVPAGCTQITLTLTAANAPTTPFQNGTMKRGLQRRHFRQHTIR